jgi:ribosome-binding protein aMBF1 (putative translation factor)
MNWIFQYRIIRFCANPRAMSSWIESEQYRAVGAVLAAARRRRGLTQQDLATQLGKPQSFVSEYERGQRRIDVVELLVISNVLGTRNVKLLLEIANAVKWQFHTLQ